MIQASFDLTRYFKWVVQCQLLCVCVCVCVCVLCGVFHLRVFYLEKLFRKDIIVSSPLQRDVWDSVLRLEGRGLPERRVSDDTVCNHTWGHAVLFLNLTCFASMSCFWVKTYRFISSWQKVPRGLCAAPLGVDFFSFCLTNVYTWVSPELWGATGTTSGSVRFVTVQWKPCMYLHVFMCVGTHTSSKIL